MVPNAHGRRHIGSLLLEYGLISDRDLKGALSAQKETGLRLGETLVAQGRITPEDIEWVLSKQLDIPFVIIDPYCIDKDLIDMFNRDFLLRNRLLPIYATTTEIAVVTDDPFNYEAIEAVANQADKTVRLSTGSGRKIEEILRHTPNAAAGTVEGVERLAARIRGMSICPRCAGKGFAGLGCDECKGLGYRFEDVRGLLTSEEFKRLRKETP